MSNNVSMAFNYTFKYLNELKVDNKNLKNKLDEIKSENKQFKKLVEN